MDERRGPLGIRTGAFQPLEQVYVSTASIEGKIPFRSYPYHFEICLSCFILSNGSKDSKVVGLNPVGIPQKRMKSGDFIRFFYLSG